METIHPETDCAAVAEAVCGLWPSLTEAQRMLVTGHITVNNYCRGDIIYRTTDPPTLMYVLVSGKVKVGKDGVGGRSQIVRVIKPVEMFGYRAFFAHAHHRTTATAFEASVVASIPMEVIECVMCENAAMALQVVNHLAVLLGQSDDRTVNLTQKHIRGRLAEALLFLRDSYGVEADGCTLSIYLNREDLACLSNMTTSNAIRTLSAFATEQIIAIDGKKIKLLNTEELAKVSRMG